MLIAQIDKITVKQVSTFLILVISVKDSSLIITPISYCLCENCYLNSVTVFTYLLNYVHLAHNCFIDATSNKADNNTSKYTSTYD